MIRWQYSTPVALLAAALLLNACTSSGVRQDQSGQLGQTQAESPADIYVNLGIAYMREGQFDIALQKLHRGLQLDSGNAQAHNVIAILYERLGEADKASDHFQNALRLAPKNPYIHNAYGSYLCKRKKYSEADTSFSQALKNPLYTTPWIALTNAGICKLQDQKDDQAEAYLRQALSLNARFSPALEQMAKMSFQQENYLSARAYLQRYREVATHTAETLDLAIRTEQALNNPDAAASYKMLLRQNFPDAPALQQSRDTVTR